MKKGIFTGLMAAMVLFGSATDVSDNYEKPTVKVNNSDEVKVIIEIAKDLDGLTEEEVHASQDKVINSIRKNVTNDFELVDRYDVLNNAIVLKIGSDKVEQLREVEGVSQVDVDKLHFKKSTDPTVTLSTAGILATEEKVSKEDQDKGPEQENISATTMNKPSGTNEGEGTLIAVLDNEFYIKGATNGESAWGHVAFNPLPAGTVERLTFTKLKSKIKTTHAGKKGFDAKKSAGQEGSCYYNSKVPFYYDYGGTAPTYGGDGVPDNDVMSSISYHGSHVSSIVGGNSNEFKGIAPKCQLACMKVFTEYKADETGKGLGFSDSSGGYDTAILSALEDAIKLGCDGINMSLGSDLDDFDQDTICLRTIARLVNDSGMMTAIAAGNGGKGSYSSTGGYGNWTTDIVETGVLGSYANSSEATIVASAQPNQVFFEHAFSSEDADGKVTNIGYEDQIVNREGLEAEFPESAQCYIKDCADPVTGEVGWVYIPNFGASSDYKGKDVEGKIAIVNRGSTSFADKYALAVQNKAKGLVIINNDPTASEFNFRCSFGDGFSPSIPCALVLYKDKTYLESKGEGVFKFIEEQASDNANAKTVSSFTNDGARFSYDIKPDVAAPGESIKGAVPPQKTEDKENTSISTYEYLSGTSMASPNYCGSQTLLLGEKAKDVYSAAKVTAEAEKEFVDYRRTIDMRLMSTAHKMLDSDVNPETKTVSPTSPRIQGAGLIDLTNAINTKVYLNGLDLEGNEINKSKIQLRNSDDIAKGDLNLKFNAYNEADTAKSYKVKLTVMRPALEKNNKVIQDKYNYIGEVDDISKMPGYTYWKMQYVPGQDNEVATQFTADGAAEQYNVVKLTKQIEYYSSKADCEADVNKKVITPGYYYNAASTGFDWQPLPDFTYQSIKDVVIYSGETGQTVTFNPGKNEVTLNKWSIPQAEKDKIAEAYEFGCAIEGYVELVAVNDDPDLSIPFLGFYSLTDKDPNKSLRTARVVEQFEFEKVDNVSYPSDLANDLAVSLLGKNNADMGSMWVTGYAESTDDIDVSKVLSNDTSFNRLTGFHSVGKDPKSGSYYDNASESIYVGSPKATNTMIIQQFVLRSVRDNYFTIKDSKGNIVYKDVLEDMLFGDQLGRYPLYKSHVDANYLGAGYISHRAYAIIPLYDVLTNEAFADGEYTIEFNYQIAYDNSWISNSYKFVVDSTLPSISSVETYNKDGEERVRINIVENKVASAVVGYSKTDVMYDEENDSYYLDLSKEEIKRSMDELGNTEMGEYHGRLFIEITDAAYGVNKMIIHFKDDSFVDYEVVECENLNVAYDFEYTDGVLRWFEIDIDGFETDIEEPKNLVYKNNFSNKSPENNENNNNENNNGENNNQEQPNGNNNEEEAKGCSASIAASSTLALISLAIGLVLIINRKKEIYGGTK